MLQRTFLHVPGVGKTTERRLWDAGCLDWDCLLAAPDRYSYGHADRVSVRHHIEMSKESLETRNHQFFSRYLGSREAWRAYEDFKESCVYLDIETDGGSSPSSITTIGLYDGQQYYGLIKGENLANFRDLITRYSMIVTFFGGGFDIPVLQRAFPDVKFDHLHFDLCPGLRRLGHRGGLKKIERDFNIERSPETRGLNGYDAVILWRRYRLMRDERALERLIAYNREDVVNLPRLAEIAFRGLKKMTLEAEPEPESVSA